MNGIRSSLLAVALLASPIMLFAQGPGQMRGQGMGAMAMAPNGTVELVLENRAALKLAAEQVTKLEAIHAAVAEKNQPLMAQLEQFRTRMTGSSPQQMSREQRQAQMREMQPVREQVVANHNASLEEAKAVLTDVQQKEFAEVVRKLAEQQQQQRRRPPTR